jgi:cbb3-type cytochrome oxidase maturation protein
MTILLVLVPLGLVLLGLAIAAFIWAVRHGQFEDLDGEAMRILLDDDVPAPAPSECAVRDAGPDESREGERPDESGT